MIKNLDQIAPTAKDVGIEDVISDKENLMEQIKVLFRSQSKCRSALLAIKEFFGESKVLQDCGLKKELGKDGSVVWIMNNAHVLKAFNDLGRVPLDLSNPEHRRVFEELKLKICPPPSPAATTTTGATKNATGTSSQTKGKVKMIGRFLGRK